MPHPPSRLAEAMARARSLDEFCRAVAAECAGITGAELRTLWYLWHPQEGPSRLSLAASFGLLAPETIGREVQYEVASGRPDSYDGITGYVASTGHAVSVGSYEGLQEQYPFALKGKLDASQWDGMPADHVRNLLAMPIRLGREIVGVLKVENREGPFTDIEETALRSLMAQLSVFCRLLSLMRK